MSSFPMIDVDVALSMVIKCAEDYPLPRPTEAISLSEANGRYLAEDIYAAEPFPPFPAAILDGYAIDAAAHSGDPVTLTFTVVDRVLAGRTSSGREVSGSACAYVTTGARLPAGANAVVGVETCEVVDGGRKVRITAGPSKRGVAAGANVRAVGKDIPAGTLCLRRATRLGPAEVGVLATLGRATVTVARRVVVGVLSTGDELLAAANSGGSSAAAAADGGGSCIRDANRPALLALFGGELGSSAAVEPLDLGVCRDDDAPALRSALARAAARCDVVVSSGGVSTGAADGVKPLLGRLGTLRFGRLNMKPGKPTTLATLPATDEASGTPCVRLAFGLPGNPVSCLVCARLLVAPALAALAMGACGAVTVPGRPGPAYLGATTTTALAMDPERPEYHRVTVTAPPAAPAASAASAAPAASAATLLATSTGAQQSSRLLSLVGANGLLLVPKGRGVLPAGTVLPCLLTGQALHPSPAAAAPAAAPVPPAVPPLAPPFALVTPGGGRRRRRRTVTCSILTACTGRGEDGGLVAACLLQTRVPSEQDRRSPVVEVRLLEMRRLARPALTARAVRDLVRAWCRRPTTSAGAGSGEGGGTSGGGGEGGPVGEAQPPHLVLVVGGCGLGPWDVVPEALEHKGVAVEDDGGGGGGGSDGGRGEKKARGDEGAAPVLTKLAPSLAHLLAEQAQAFDQRVVVGAAESGALVAALPWVAAEPEDTDAEGRPRRAIDAALAVLLPLLPRIIDSGYLRGDGQQGTQTTARLS